MGFKPPQLIAQTLATMLIRTLLFSIIMMLGCKSPGFITNVRTSPDFVNQFHEITDIFFLGYLVVTYHKDNHVWPERLTDLNFTDDTLKLFLTNFDTVNLNSKNGLIQVDYKLSKERKIITPIEFIDSDSVTDEPKHIIWPPILDNLKFQNNEFDGTLTIIYDDGLYHINKDPAKDEHSR